MKMLTTLLVLILVVTIRAENDSSDDLEKRVIKLEKNFEAIKQYLRNSKKKDIVLKTQTEDVINEMDAKKKETEELIIGLKPNVQNSLDEFEGLIKQVNVSAHQSINVEGVVYYGGIGSACSSGNNECQLDQSECRDNRCQCEVGLSYDWKTKSCVASCAIYGTNYQSVPNRIIRGYNNREINETEIADCKQACFEEMDFTCRSIDWFPRWNTCYLSENVQTDVEEDAWEYNYVGRHYQRDCE